MENLNYNENQILQLIKQNTEIKAKYDNLKSRFAKSKLNIVDSIELMASAYKLSNKSNSTDLKNKIDIENTYDLMEEQYKNADYSSFMIKEFM